MDPELERKFISEEFGKWVEEHNILKMEELKLENIRLQHYDEVNTMVNTLAEIPDKLIQQMVDRHLKEEHKQFYVIDSYKQGLCHYPPLDEN